MAGKFREIWEIIEMPVYILIVWSIIGWLMTVYELLPQNYISSLIGWLITLAAFGYIGYIVIKKREQQDMQPRQGRLPGQCQGL